MNQLTEAPSISTAPAVTSEAGPLAAELARAYEGTVEYYRRDLQLTGIEAIAKADEPQSSDYEHRCLTCLPDQVAWRDLQELTAKDPNLAVERWEEIKQQALDELRSGHRAAKAVDAENNGPWDRARFLAIRQELADGWRARNGMERTLIDKLAVAHVAYLFWLEKMVLFSTLEPAGDNETIKDEGRWNPPRVMESEAVDQAAKMAERFDRIFVRTLRALTELRKHLPTVIVQNNAGQINVGDRVNVSSGDITQVP